MKRLCVVLLVMALCLLPVLADDAGGSIVEGTASSIEDAEEENNAQLESDDQTQQQETGQSTVSSLEDSQFAALTDNLVALGGLIIASMGVSLGYKSGRDLLGGTWR